MARPIRPRAPNMPILVIAPGSSRRFMGEPAAYRKQARIRNRRRRLALRPETIGRVTMAEREREVIVTNDGGGGGGTALIAVVVLVAVLAILFFVFKDSIMGNGNPTDIKADVKIDTPATGR
jgi:hypothetical protein